MEAERDVRPVKLKDLPKYWQAEARRQAGVRPQKQREQHPAENRIPASWVDHKDQYGWAGSSGPCPYCNLS